MRFLFAVQASLVFVIGALAHFSFDAIGRWAPLGWIAPVNESLWEHIKMAFWPALIIGWLVGAPPPTRRHRVVCTTVSAWVSTVLIVPLFHAYTGILGHHHLVGDVAIFAIAVALGHWTSYRIALGPRPTRISAIAAAGLAVWLGAALVVFTYLPPRMDLFRDSLSGQYGLGD